MNANRTAKQAYENDRRDIACLVDMFEQELEAHAERAAAEPRNWGFAGDLHEAKHRLIQALAMISGINDDNIEEALAEMAEDQNAK